MKREELELWFMEATQRLPVFTSHREEFVIHRGFRISKDEDGMYRLRDVRGDEDRYLDLMPDDLERIRGHGFVKGCDYNQYTRGEEIIKEIDAIVVALYEKRFIFAKELKRSRRVKPKRLNQKRIRNINVKIDNWLEQMFSCKVRADQFLKKYNLIDKK